MSKHNGWKSGRSQKNETKSHQQTAYIAVAGQCGVESAATNTTVDATTVTTNVPTNVVPTCNNDDAFPTAVGNDSSTNLYNAVATNDTVRTSTAAVTASI